MEDTTCPEKIASVYIAGVTCDIREYSTQGVQRMFIRNVRDGIGRVDFTNHGCLQVLLA